ncbi:MAG: energy transducer TonB [Pseudoxanthomonas sp.]
MTKSIKSYLIAALLACGFTIQAARAQEPVPDRLADGTVVPANTNFVRPVPVDPFALTQTAPFSLMRGKTKAHYEADLLISETGEVLDVTVTTSVNAPFDRAVSKHMRQVPFKPATLDGTPTKALFRAVLDVEAAR